MFSELKPHTLRDRAAIAWLGRMPEHWATARGKSLFHREKREPLEGDGVVTCFRDGQVTLRSNRRLTGFTEAIQEHGYQRILKGDLVIHAMDAFAGAVGVADSDGKSSPVYAACTPLGTANAHYFAEVVREMARTTWIAALSRGVRERSTDFRFESFANQMLPVPPVDEQAAIVKYIGHAHARIDQAIAAKRKLIALLEEQKQAIIHQAVTRGLDPSVPLKDSGIARIGMVPAHWEVLPLKRLARFKSGAGFPIAAQGRTGLELPFAKVSDMNRPGNEEWMATADSWISRGDAKELGAYIFPVGTVVFPKVGGALLTNKRRRLRVPACIDNNVMGAVFGRMVSDDFGYLTLSLVDMGLHVNPGPVPAIGESAVGRIVVTVPPRREQSDIVDYTVEATRSLTGVVRRVMREIELLREFRTRLTSDVVTGQVDVREIAATLPELTDEVRASADDEFGDDDDLIESELELVGADE